MFLFLPGLDLERFIISNINFENICHKDIDICGIMLKAFSEEIIIITIHIKPNVAQSFIFLRCEHGLSLVFFSKN